MRLIIIFIFCFYVVSCSHGVSSSKAPSLAASDYGKSLDGTVKTNTFDLKRTDGTAHSEYYSSGCHQISVGGSCQVQVKYSGTGNMLGTSLGIQILPAGSYTSSDLVLCSKISNSTQTCIFTIQHVVGNPTRAFVNIYAQKPSRTIGVVNVSSTLQPQLKSTGIGAGDILNLAGEVFGPIASDAIENLLGIDPKSAIDNELDKISAQIAALTSTVNQILTGVKTIENIEITEFSVIESALANQSLQAELNTINPNLNTISSNHSQFMGVVSSGTCPANQAPQYTYLSESEIASSVLYTSAVLSALGCSRFPVKNPTITCSSLTSSYEALNDLLVGVSQTPDRALFKAVNNVSLENLGAQNLISTIQSNNETVMAYSMQILQAVQETYNMIHVGLYLSQSPKHSSSLFSGLEYPVPNMSFLNSYQQNKDALDTYFTSLSGGLLDDTESSIMTDNPGDPAILWSHNTSASLSPKLLATQMPTIPVGAGSWAGICNIFEWAGALTPNNYVASTLTQVCNASGQITTVVQTPSPTPVSDYTGQLNATQLGTKCYNQGQSNQSSINFSNCMADLNGGPASAVNIHAALVASPYLECNIPIQAPNLSSISCLKNNCFQAQWPRINEGYLIPAITFVGETVQPLLYTQPAVCGPSLALSQTNSQILLTFSNGEVLPIASTVTATPMDYSLSQQCKFDLLTIAMGCLPQSQYIDGSSCSMDSTYGNLTLKTKSGIVTYVVVQSGMNADVTVNISLPPDTCFTAADCPIGNQCLAGQCTVICANNSDCGNPFPVCAANGLCVPCTTNVQCADYPGGANQCLEGSCGI